MLKNLVDCIYFRTVQQLRGNKSNGDAIYSLQQLTAALPNMSIVHWSEGCISAGAFGLLILKFSKFHETDNMVLTVSNSNAGCRYKELGMTIAESAFSH